MCHKQYLCLIFYISVCLILQCTSDCQKYKEDYICTLEDILQEEISVKRLHIIPNQNSDEQRITNNIFTHIHNVKGLHIGGPVKFEEESFENLENINVLELLKVYLNGERNLFNNLNLRNLIISQCNITKLIPGWFENQQHLTKLLIGENNINNIPPGVFNNSNIQFLMLYKNNIETIEDKVFYGMNNIKILSLGENLLTEFNAVSYFGDVQTNLKVLGLQRNNLTTITRNTLCPFPNLTMLFLLENNIEFIEENAFQGLFNITYLDLSSNKLQTLQPSLFLGFSSLDVLFLHNNKFAYLPMETLDHMGILTKISIGLNPWTCSCRRETLVYLENRNVTLLCDNESQHKCVQLAEENNNCVREKYGVLYKQHKKIFDALDYKSETHAPICKIRCSNGTSCFSHSYDNDFYIYIPDDIQYLLSQSQ